MDLTLDKLKVYELLMYHDLVELETGDISVDDLESRKYKVENGIVAMKKIGSEMPSVLSEKYIFLFEEFEDKITLAFRFANAIDKLDADLHCIDSLEEDIMGGTEKLARERKQKYYIKFLKINDAFEKILAIYKERGLMKE